MTGCWVAGLFSCSLRQDNANEGTADVFYYYFLVWAIGPLSYFVMSLRMLMDHEIPVKAYQQCVAVHHDTL